MSSCSTVQASLLHGRVFDIRCWQWLHAKSDTNKIKNKLWTFLEVSKSRLSSSTTGKQWCYRLISLNRSEMLRVWTIFFVPVKFDMQSRWETSIRGVSPVSIYLSVIFTLTNAQFWLCIHVSGGDAAIGTYRMAGLSQTQQTPLQSGDHAISRW